MARPRKLSYAWERDHLWRDPTVRRWVYIALSLALLLVLVFVVDAREERAADKRVTRAAIGVVFDATLAYRADHDRVCPADSRALYAAGYTKTLQTDAWGKPLRIICPGRKDPRGFDVVSDGPDGEPLGLDRVE